MFCDNYTLNTVTLYNLLIFSSLVEVMKHHFSILSNANYELTYYVIFNIRKILFQAHVLLQRVTLERIYTKKITEKKKFMLMNLHHEKWFMIKLLFMTQFHIDDFFLSIWKGLDRKRKAMSKKKNHLGTWMIYEWYK